MLTFNNSGLLVPDDKIKSTISEFQFQFVDGIQSQTRSHIFDRYLAYNIALKTITGLEIVRQWVDGSFVTRDTNPGDIDLVTFIDFQVLESVGQAIKPFLYPASEINYGIDGYVVEVFPEGHPRAFLTLSDNAYWLDRFTKTRRNRAGNKFAKGFLEIIS